MKHFNEYIKLVRASGAYTFTKQEAMAKLGITLNSFYCGVYNLKKKGDLVSPAKNFYVIIPPEYQKFGCLPAEELVPLLMKHWDINYYVCLLSAALYHGASHQKPQIFQVMTEKQLKPLECGKIRIEFLYKKSLESLPIQKKVVKTGYLNISSPELTVMDSLMYLQQSGGLNHVATVFTELIEVVNAEKMLNLVQRSKEKAWIQRLGYILEHIEPLETKNRDSLIEQLITYLKKQSVAFIPLAAELPVKNLPSNKRNRTWMVVENTNIESDI